MSLARWDGTVQDAQGRALSGALIYFCTQPANTSVYPPTPLATIYSDLSGDPLAQPVVTDGFGHADAYLDDGQLYTIVYNHPLFPAPMVFPDQSIGGGGGSGTSYTPVQASTAAGTITGTIPGSTFTLPSTPVANSLLLAQNGIVLTPGLGYTLTGTTITLATALAAGEGLDAKYLLAS